MKLSIVLDSLINIRQKKIGQLLKVDRNSRLVVRKGLISNDLGQDLADLISY
jgi:hypothetical protein